MGPKALLKLLKVQSPNILTAAAIGLGFAAGIFAVNEVPAAKEIVKKMKEENASGLEIAKTVAPMVKKTAIAGTGAVVCAVAANRISAERLATITTAYNMLQTTTSQYKDKVKEIVGEEKAAEINKAALQKRLDSVPSEVINNYEDLGGDIYFIDEDTGMEFLATMDALKAAVKEINYQMAAGDDSATLKDLFEELGIYRPCRLAAVTGWNINEGKIEPEFSWVEPREIARNGGRVTMPCCYVDFFGYNRMARKVGYGQMH